MLKDMQVILYTISIFALYSPFEIKKPASISIFRLYRLFKI